TIVFILPLHLDYTKVIILILWWRNFQLEYWRTFQLVSTIKNIMKVDFTKFPLFTGIDRQDMVIADIRKDIADGIYRNVPGLPAHVLAEKIYRNELVELADDEIHILDLYTSASVGQLADSWQDYKKNNLETETGK
ncbi:hypothetical protein, partial [Phocaeicola vulgatus]